MNEQEFLNNEEALKPLQNKKDLQNELYIIIKEVYKKHSVDAYTILQILSNRQKIIDYIISKSNMGSVEVERCLNSYFDKYNKQFLSIYQKDFNIKQQEEEEKQKKQEKAKNIILATFKILGCILLFPIYLVLICSFDFEKKRKRYRRYR